MPVLAVLMTLVLLQVGDMQRPPVHYHRIWVLSASPIGGPPGGICRPYDERCTLLHPVKGE